MDRIYHHDDTMYVVGTKVYDNADGFAYMDSGYKTKISAEDLERIFVEGMIIVDSSGIMYKPISCKVEEKLVTITYAATDTDTVTSAKLVTIKSEN